MASVTFNIQLNSGTESDLPNGRTLNAYISPNGTFPVGAYVTSATLYVSRFRCYTGSNARLQIDSYGTTAAFAKNDANHSETVSVTLNNDIISATGNSITLTVQSGNNGNAQNFRSDCSMTLTVNYEINASAFSTSTATLTKTSIEAGGQIGISISNTHLSDVSHKQVWSCGSYSSTVNLTKGISSSSFTVPTNWINAITRAVSGIGYVKVSTVANGVTIGSNTYSFTITVPSSVVPTIGSVTATRIDNTVPSTWGIYVQNKSGVKITVNNAAGAYGSTISSYVYSGGASATSTQNTLTVNTLYSSGTVTFTVKVVDSRGRSASKNVSITIQPYAAPKFLSSSAFRCNSSGTASEEGKYISSSASYQYSTCSSKNTIKCNISYGVAGSNSWTTGKSGAASGTSYVFGGNAISLTNSYQVKFSLTDSFTTVERIVDVNTTSYTLFFQRGGNAIGVGMECSTGASNLMEINPEWDIKRGSVKLFEYLQSFGFTLANNLTTSTSGKSALDAYQGYVLNNKFNNYVLKSNIIYSSTQPAVVNGAIWLKPV